MFLKELIMELVFASANENKYEEFLSILNTSDVRLINTFKLNESEVIENQNTFKDNAALKALAYARTFNQVALADDSGLVVDAIKPLPGIYSKRYSGLGDLENNLKLLQVLKNNQNRDARFVCVIAIAFPDGKIFTYEGNMLGTIALTLKGGMGFGYDPIFIPKNEQATLAELGPAFKDQYSHRSIALNNFLEAKDEVIDYWRYTWQK